MRANTACNNRIDYSNFPGERILPFVFSFEYRGVDFDSFRGRISEVLL